MLQQEKMTVKVPGRRDGGSNQLLRDGRSVKGETEKKLEEMG